jgi:hypothetical protein
MYEGALSEDGVMSFIARIASPLVVVGSMDDALDLMQRDGNNRAIFGHGARGFFVLWPSVVFCFVAVFFSKILSRPCFFGTCDSRMLLDRTHLVSITILA